MRTPCKTMKFEIVFFLYIITNGGASNNAKRGSQSQCQLLQIQAMAVFRRLNSHRREKIRPNDLGLFGHRWRGCSEAAVCFGASSPASLPLSPLTANERGLSLLPHILFLLPRRSLLSQSTDQRHKNVLCGKSRGRGIRSIPVVNTDSKMRSFVIEEKE